jgi:hypothetical protein
MKKVFQGFPVLQTLLITSHSRVSTSAGDDCTGTGGSRVSHACPKPSSASVLSSFPHKVATSLLDSMLKLELSGGREA